MGKKWNCSAYIFFYISIVIIFLFYYLFLNKFTRWRCLEEHSFFLCNFSIALTTDERSNPGEQIETEIPSSSVEKNPLTRSIHCYIVLISPLNLSLSPILSYSLSLSPTLSYSLSLLLSHYSNSYMDFSWANI